MEEFEKKANNEENTVVSSKRKKGIIIGVVIGLIIGLLLVFTCTNYKLLFSPKKMSFLSNITKDITSISEVFTNISDEEIFEYFSTDDTKVLSANVKINDALNTGSLILDKDFFALNFADNYYLLSNEKLDEFWTKLGLENSQLPSKLEADNDLMLTSKEKKQIKKFAVDCGYEILEQFSEDDFTAQAKETVSINNNEIEAKSIAIRVDLIKFMEIQKIIAEKLLNSDIIDIYVEKMQVVTKEEVIEAINDYIKSIDYVHSTYMLEEEIYREQAIVYKMYFNDNIISREIIQEYTQNGEVVKTVIASLITDINNYYELKFVTQEGNGVYNIVISDLINVKEDRQNHLISYVLEGITLYNEEGTYNYEYIPVKNEARFNLLIKNLENGSKKIEFANIDNSYNFYIEYNTEAIDAKFNYNGENTVSVALDCIIDNSLTKEKILNQGAIELNSKTKEELQQEFINLAGKLS